MALTALKVAHLKTPGRYSDGLGLYLQVDPGGTKRWVFRYKRNGKTTWLGLGPLHSVNLAEARTRARQQRQLILDQHDPLAVKREAQQALIVSTLKAMTFREAALNFLATDKIEGTQERQGTGTVAIDAGAIRLPRHR